jgi:hypothetical protein
MQIGLCHFLIHVVHRYKRGIHQFAVERYQVVASSNQQQALHDDDDDDDGTMCCCIRQGLRHGNLFALFQHVDHCHSQSLVLDALVVALDITGNTLGFKRWLVAVRLFIHERLDRYQNRTDRVDWLP